MGGTGGAGGAEYPAETITSAQLLAGFTDEYFELNSDNQLVFTAPANGATTLPYTGSNHTRSELHEYYTGPDAVSDGCWLSGLGGTLQATAVINAAPVDSTEVTVGQIHGNGGAAFALLIYRPTSWEVSLKVYTSPTTTTYTDTTIDQNVTPGSTINYRLSFQNGTITATANGNTVTVTAGNAWDSYPVRFDLGAYSDAPSTGNPSGRRDTSDLSFLQCEPLRGLTSEDSCRLAVDVQAAGDFGPVTSWSANWVW